MRWGRARNRQRRSSLSNRSKLSANYYKSNKPAAASPFRSKPSAKPSWLSKIINYSLLLVLAAGLVYSLGVKPSPKVELSSDIYHTQNDYQQAIVSQLKALRSRSKLTINQSGIGLALKRQFPEIRSVDINLGLFSQVPKFKLTINEPSFNLTSGGVIYVINSAGVAVAKADQLAAASRLISVLDQSDYKVEIGKQALGSDQVSFINAIIAQCKNAKIPIASLTLPPLAQQVDLRTTDRSYLVKFQLSGDASQQIGQYLAVRSKFDSVGSHPNEYIDVRVEGKIFYK